MEIDLECHPPGHLDSTKEYECNKFQKNRTSRPKVAICKELAKRDRFAAICTCVMIFLEDTSNHSHMLTAEMCFSKTYALMSKTGGAPDVSLSKSQSIWTGGVRGVNIENYLDPHIVADGTDVHAYGAHLADLVARDEGAYEVKGLFVPVCSILQARQETLFPFTETPVIDYIAQCILNIVTAETGVGLKAPVSRKCLTVISKCEPSLRIFDTVCSQFLSRRKRMLETVSIWSLGTACIHVYMGTCTRRL